MVERKRRTQRTFVALAAALSLLAGCSDDSRSTRHQQRTTTVRTVTHYGITLDREAGPKEVAFVALRAIKDDFEASDMEAREAALDIQFDVCAAGLLKPSRRARMTEYDYLYRVVDRWTPAFSHYVADFETEWSKAKERMVATAPTDRGDDVETCEVLMEVDDVRADRDPNARVVIAVWLLRDDGYWRVSHLGFRESAGSRALDSGRRHIPSKLIKASEVREDTAGRGAAKRN